MRPFFTSATVPHGVAAGTETGKKFGGGLVAAAKGFIAPLAAVFAVQSGVDFFKGAIEEASGLGESMNALHVVFGDSANGIADLGKNAAHALGLSNLEFNNLAVRFSSFAKTIAGDGGDVTGTMKDLTGRASDFASVMNIDVAEAAQVFQSGLSGETEPLKRFGIDLSDAAVKAYAVANGISDGSAQMTEAQKVQARYGLLMEKTAQTQGDFANTSDGLANQQRILASQWADMKARIGSVFLPAVTQVVTFFNSSLLPAFDTVGAAVGALGDLLIKGDFTAAFSSIFGIQEDSPVVDLLLNARQAVLDFFAAFTGDGAGSASGLFASIQTALAPLTQMVLDLAASFTTSLLPVLTGLWTTLTTTIVPAVLSVVQTIGAALWPVLLQVVSFVTSTVVPVWNALSEIFTGTVLPAVRSFADFVANVLAPKIADLISQVSANLQPVLDAIRGFITDRLVPAVQQIADKFREWQPAIQAVIEVVVSIISWVVKFASAILGTVIPPILSFAGFLLSHLVPAILGTIEFVGKIIAAVWNFGSALVGGIASAIDFARGIGEQIGNVLSTVRDLPGNALAALGNLGTLLLSAGGDLMRGFIQGIRNGAANLISTIKSTITDALPDFVKKALGIHSPSRVFMALGEHTAAGMALGIENGAQAVQDAADALVPNAPAWGSPDSGGGLAASLAASVSMPSVLEVCDTDGALVGRMQVEAGRVQEGSITPLHLGRSSW